MSGESTSNAVIPNDQSQAEIFKLKMDHFEELFDWLSLEDLAGLSQTCKRMQSIVGYYIKMTYAGKEFLYEREGIYLRDKDGCIVDEMKFNGLSSFLKKLVFPHTQRAQNWENLDRIPHVKADRFKSLKEITLCEHVVIDKGISLIKEILEQLETVKLIKPTFCDENTEFYESFLKFCTNVKKLCIHASGWSKSIIGADDSWLLRKYPTLEHVELASRLDTISELQTFFEQNPNIKNIAMDEESVYRNENAFINNNELKLDVLSIRLTSRNPRLLDILNQLHERGQFKQLHVYAYMFGDEFSQNYVDKLVSFKSVTKLFIWRLRSFTDLSSLINLKHLYIQNAADVTDMENLAKKLVNLEFIQFTRAKDDDIIPFIRYSPKSNIVVFRLDENFGNLLKIEELNEERSKLGNVRKINIYVEEHVYLAVKWAKNKTNWSLIDIKRGVSYDQFNHNFESILDKEMTF